MTNLPFSSHWFTLSDGTRLHYFDEGSGEPVLMLHGNPTWSYMYRDLIRRLTPGHRAIALDLPGFGLSDKPESRNYCLRTHADAVWEFIRGVVGTRCNFVLHDWGGPIGLLVAAEHPEVVNRIVLMNTVAWTTRQFPKAIYLTKCPFIGAFLVRVMNVLIHVALRKVPLKKLPPQVEELYRMPYISYKTRVAVQRFPQDIPLSPKHQSYGLFQTLRDSLSRLDSKSVFILWGDTDFCFPLAFLDEWKKLLPGVRVSVVHASHFLLEDEPEVVTSSIKSFLES